tara:strand:+ start:375 stop:614 length:240 start_codon:yes stop_codon:yes gene_type:complete
MSTSSASTGSCGTPLLNRELFDTPEEARVLVEGWRQEYKPLRLHSALGYQLPAREAFSWPTDAVLLGGSGLIAPLFDLP